MTITNNEEAMTFADKYKFAKKLAEKNITEAEATFKERQKQNDTEETAGAFFATAERMIS